MPHALLLSPDDQAVNAITGVLEEMSVTCERPLDGVSAAQKLNSQSFDLVLVDCENLPAAKLIFDVCRRGKNGHNPVPIAIVDGRAGLPTAFRLGAELILTKPVAKDQARTTIRTAVSRVRKDAPTEAAPSTQTLVSPVSNTTVVSTVAKQDQAKAATATASSQLTSFADPVPSFSPSATRGSSSATDEQHTAPVPSKASPLLTGGAVSLPEFPDSSAAKSLASKAPITMSDHPVLAESESAELEPSALEEVQAPKVQKLDSGLAKTATDGTTTSSDAPVFSSYQQKRQKPRPAFVVLMVLVIAAGGFYGAWMYQPGFRALAQPQIDRVLALAGTALPPTQAQQPPRPVAQPAPVQVAAATTPAVDPSKAESPAPDSTASTAVPSASSLPTPANASSAPPQPSSQTVAGASQPSLPAVTVASTVEVSKTAATRPHEIKKAELKKAQLTAAPSDAPLPGENSTIILSSKGAEKRLAHSVPPKYPSEARSEGTEGTVVLKEIVDENGKVEGVRLVEGNATLATAAMQAVKQWRYRPYVRDGKAQPFQTVVIVDFQKP